MNARYSVVSIKNSCDMADAISLLSEGFPKENWWKDVLNDFKLSENSTGGMLLKIDGVSQGVMLLFEHERLVNAKLIKLANISSWYVRLEFRNFTKLMLEKVIEDENKVYTVFTASKFVHNRFFAAGFRLVSNGAVLSPPLLNNQKKNKKVSISSIKTNDPVKTTNACFNSIAIHQHSHLPFIALKISDPISGKATKIVLRFFLRRHIRFCRLVFTDNPEFLVESLSSIKIFLLIKYFCAGIYLPNFHPYNKLKNYFPSIASPSILVKGPLPEADITLFYSEYLYLPI